MRRFLTAVCLVAFILPAGAQKKKKKQKEPQASTTPTVVTLATKNMTRRNKEKIVDRLTAVRGVLKAEGDEKKRLVMLHLTSLGAVDLEAVSKALKGTGVAVDPTRLRLTDKVTVELKGAMRGGRQGGKKRKRGRRQYTGAGELDEALRKLGVQEIKWSGQDRFELTIQGGQLPYLTLMRLVKHHGSTASGSAFIRNLHWKGVRLATPPKEKPERKQKPEPKPKPESKQKPEPENNKDAKPEKEGGEPPK